MLSTFKEGSVTSRTTQPFIQPSMIQCIKCVMHALPLLENAERFIYQAKVF